MSKSPAIKGAGKENASLFVHSSTAARRWWLGWALGLTTREDEAGREHRHTIRERKGEAAHTKRRNWRHRRRAADVGDSIQSRFVNLAALIIPVLISVATPAVSVFIFSFPSRLWSVVATLVGLHATTDCLGGDTLADLDVRLLDNHPRLNRLSTTSTILSSQHPLSVCISELADGNDADACGVVATITWPETNPPSGLPKIALA